MCQYLLIYILLLKSKTEEVKNVHVQDPCAEQGKFEIQDVISTQIEIEIVTKYENYHAIFSSLVYGVILNPHPGILTTSNVLIKRESPLTLNYRLFVGTHVPDIAVPFGKEAERLTSKDNIVVELKETYKSLDETIKTYPLRMIILESMIKALTK